MKSIPSVPEGYKYCIGCHSVFPTTPDYWHFSRGKCRPRCKPCTLVQNKTWKNDNSESYKAQQSEYGKLRWVEHKDELSAKFKAWRESNLEYSRQRVRDYYHANKDKERARHRRWCQQSAPRRLYMIAYLKEWRKNNPERARYLGQRWMLENPDKARAFRKASKARRAARLRQAGGTITRHDVLLMFKSQKAKCWYCQCDISGGYHLEHRIPLSRGGSNDPSNVVLACADCNLSKGAKLPHEWNGRLL
jgi:5-methylcytosine-specific restriction endonuclease McrA